MTAQFSDSFIYKNKNFTLTSFSEEPFNPEKYGMNPAGMCTACYRGYVCTYGLANNHLTLKDLEVNLIKLSNNNSYISIK